jgi:hypothetical protein
MLKDADTLGSGECVPDARDRLERLVAQTLAQLAGGDPTDYTWGCVLVTRLVTLRDELVHRLRQAELLEPLSELIDRCQSATRPTPAQARALAQEFRQIVCELGLDEALQDQTTPQGSHVSLPPVEQVQPAAADSLRLI